MVDGFFDSPSPMASFAAFGLIDGWWDWKFIKGFSRGIPHGGFSNGKLNFRIELIYDSDNDRDHPMAESRLVFVILLGRCKNQPIFASGDRGVRNKARFARFLSRRGGIQPNLRGLSGALQKSTDFCIRWQKGQKPHDFAFLWLLYHPPWPSFKKYW